MPATTDAILAHLKLVDAERERRSAVPGLGTKVAALKEFQQRRFSHTYADLLLSKRYGPAARFFLDELYGPTDFTRRDTQFARVVPALVRLFPSEIVATVATLAELHAMSESLDTAMANQLETPDIDAVAYVRAWQGVGRSADRHAQIALTLRIAERLDRFTRNPLLRSSLRLMSRPARAAGLGELQRFLEAGFDTFREMKGARDFMTMVRTREEALADALFAADPGDQPHGDAVPGRAMERALAALPQARHSKSSSTFIA